MKTKMFRGGFPSIKLWILTAGLGNEVGREREQGRRLTERKLKNIRILDIGLELACDSALMWEFFSNANHMKLFLIHIPPNFPYLNQWTKYQ